jgi:uncharacterized protein
VRYGWDDQKDERCWRERGFGFQFASLIFEGRTIEWVDNRRDYGEVRMRALELANGRLLHVVFTDRGDVRRIISARPANRKERVQWHASR